MTTAVADQSPCFGRTARVSTAVVAKYTSRCFKTGMLVQPLYCQFFVALRFSRLFCQIGFTLCIVDCIGSPSDVKLYSITVSVCGHRCLFAPLLVDREAQSPSSFLLNREERSRNTLRLAKLWNVLKTGHNSIHKDLFCVIFYHRSQTRRNLF